MIIAMNRQVVPAVGEAFKTIAFAFWTLDFLQSGKGTPAHGRVSALVGRLDGNSKLVRGAFLVKACLALLGGVVFREFVRTFRCF